MRLHGLESFRLLGSGILQVRTLEKRENTRRNGLAFLLQGIVPIQGSNLQPSPEIQTGKVGRNCGDSSAECILFLPHQTTEGREPAVEPEAARRKAFEVFFKLKKCTISRESMECVYYNIKIISSPSICVQLQPQEGVLGLLGDLGTRPTPPRGADPAPAPRAPDPEAPPPTQTSCFPHARSVPVLTCSRHCSSLTISCLLPLFWSLPSVGPRSRDAPVLTVPPPHTQDLPPHPHL